MELKNKIAIIYTTFLRDELELESLKTIMDNWQDNYVLLIGDQGTPNSNKTDFYTKLESNVETPNRNIKCYYLPFDCGISYARNFLVQKAQELGCQYCLLTADSIMFTQKYNFQPLIEFLEGNESRGMVGLDIFGRVSWERDMELVPGKHFHLTLPKRNPILYQNIKFLPCDIIRNLFLAKTECLLDVPWDAQFKMGEHEDHFWRMKLSKWQVFYTNYILTQYKNFKPFEYNNYRRRMYNEFRALLHKKYKISGWVKYER